ncbi:MAG: hypothetical protein JWQ30_302 [Sediminibacterium sp.]|nr:hypothetical protein [Sediminibacterium sp.]
MADKSFEQQVKEELSALRLKPDASVWPIVEAALHKERKRRWLVWLFLLAGGAGAAFWGYNHFSQDGETRIAKIPAQIRSSQKEETKEILKTEDTKQAISKIQIQKRTEEPATTSVASGEPMKNRTGLHQTVNHIDKNIPAKVQTSHDVLAEKNTQSRVLLKSKDTNQNYDDPKPSSATITTRATDNDISGDNRKGIEKETPVTKQNTRPKDSALVSNGNEEKTKQAETPPVTPTLQNEAPAAPATVSTKKNKWQWSIVAEAGSGGLRKSLPVGFSTANDFAVSTPNNSNNNQAFAGKEPTIKDAPAFGIQLQATKQISKKHRLGISAGYSLLQTRMNVGKRVDSALTSAFNGTAAWFSTLTGSVYSSYYYNSTDSIAYTSKYHFLRLGADLFTPFRLFKKIDLQWQLGAGINILAATNGLHFDPVTRKLFSNNALYTKTQSYISTGIDLSIGKEPFLYIGPHWQYSLSNLTSQPGGGQHLFLSAVRASFVLPKKKK